ncbi:MAG: DUF2240 family protein [Thermoplasmata archaeon]
MELKDSEIMLIQIFKKAGKEVLSKKDIVDIMSYKFRWGAPSDMENKMEKILNECKGICTVNDDYVTIKKEFVNEGRQYHIDDVGKGNAPSMSNQEKGVEKAVEQPKTPMDLVLEYITSRGINKESIQKKVEQFMFEKKVYLEIAYLFYLMNYEPPSELIGKMDSYIKKIHFHFVDSTTP